MRAEDLPSGARRADADGLWNLVVIGAGPAGLAAARMAASLGARVALIERDLLGGGSLDSGCVPSKTLIRSSRVLADLDDARRYGVAPLPPRDPREDERRFADAMRRVRRVRARVGRACTADELARVGVTPLFGEARFVDARTVAVGGRRLRFAKALIATGARPRSPEVEGLEAIGYLDAERAFELERLPPRLLVIGGGPLGTELGQAFRRLGSTVTLVHDEAKFLPREERDAAQLLSDSMARDGVRIRLDTRAVRAGRDADGTRVELLQGGRRDSVTVDQVIAGIGRTPRVDGLDLERAGIAVDPRAGILVDDRLRTTNARVYAAGDVCGEHRFAHVAEATARVAVANALFLGRRRASRLTVPWCTYTDPEIAHVGLYVDEANRRGLPVKTYTVLMHEVDRAITDGEEQGFVKVHVRGGSDRILGATIVARHAGEMIGEITLAMQRGIGLASLSRVIHCYPTQAAAIKAVADACAEDRLTPLRRALSERWLRRCRRD